MRRFLLLLTLALLLPLSSLAQAPDEVDEPFLRGVGLPTDTDSLLEFIRRRTTRDVNRTRLQALTRQLAIPQEADQAQKELTLYGVLAVPLLKDVENQPQAEVKKRVQKCLADIETSKGPDPAAAAARLLAHRQATGAIDVLFNYFGFLAQEEESLREEVLIALERLTYRQGKMDPLLLAALKSPLPSRRAAAVYILGRRGGLEQRDTVRQFLADPDTQVKHRALQSLAGKRALLTWQDLANSDQDLLRHNNVGADDSSILDFLRKRTLSESDQEKLRQLVRQLGDVSYPVRLKAARSLLSFSTPALAFLKPALNDADLETARRARQIMDEIQSGPGPALPAAAIRLLARPQPAAALSPALAIRVILDYLPFADDEAVEEEALTALAILGLREVKVDPQFSEALHDPLPARRAAAAHVLGRIGTSEHGPSLRKLLDDPVTWVRLRSAQGLLAARDKTAVPRFISLLADAPPHAIWQVEEVLHRLAGYPIPAEPVGDAPPPVRQKAARAWEKWWQEHAPRIDLARLSDSDHLLGLTTICEYDSANGRVGGQVWECARDGKPRWRIQDVQGPMDAHALPNGRVLIAENSGQKVTERDLAGNIKWQHQLQGNPIACQRLPNGNTFIATYNQVLEVKPGGQVEYSHNRGPGFYIFSARKVRNHIVCITAQGMIIEFDALTGKDVRTFSVGQTGGWCSVESLPNGRYLVATMSNGQVREIDATGKAHWQCQFQGAFRATRLPNGHTLVASMTNRKIAEFDRAGHLRWERQCEGRPWSLHYR